MFELIQRIGDSPTKWESYIENQKALLEEEISTLREDLEDQRA